MPDKKIGNYSWTCERALREMGPSGYVPKAPKTLDKIADVYSSQKIYLGDSVYARIDRDGVADKCVSIQQKYSNEKK